MSSTNRGAERAPNDLYVTPAWCVEAVLPLLPMGGSILDPCCGTGAILDVVRERIDSPEYAYGYDLVTHPGVDLRQRDALSVEGWQRPDLVITNPPYSLAEAFVERAIAETAPHGGTVAMLLRLAFLASRKRVALLRAHPPDVHVLSRRPSFTGGGTDSADYAWFVFGPGRGGRWSILDAPPARGAAS